MYTQINIQYMCHVLAAKFRGECVPWPFGGDFPNINHASSEKEDREVVITYSSTCNSGNPKIQRKHVRTSRYMHKTVGKDGRNVAWPPGHSAGVWMFSCQRRGAGGWATSKGLQGGLVELSPMDRWTPNETMT